MKIKCDGCKASINVGEKPAGKANCPKCKSAIAWNNVSDDEFESMVNRDAARDKRREQIREENEDVVRLLQQLVDATKHESTTAELKAIHKELRSNRQQIRNIGWWTFFTVAILLFSSIAYVISGAISVLAE